MNKVWIKGRSDNPDEALVHRNITFRRHLAPSPSNRFDLVIAHRVLVELASHDARIDLITSLWNRTNKLVPAFCFFSFEFFKEKPLF